MKIGIVAEWLDVSRGGAETSTLQFMDCLIERGLRIEVFTRSELPERAGLSFRTTKVEGGRASATRNFLDKTENFVRQTDCDLIHAFVPIRGAHIYQPRGGTVPETIERTIATRPNRVSAAWKRLLMRFNARQRLMLHRERSWLTGNTPPRVFALSNYVAAQLRDHYSFPESHIRLIRNGITPKPATDEIRKQNRAEVRMRYGVGESELLLVAVCHNFRLKGVEHLIRCAGLLHRDLDVACRVLIVGKDRPDRWERLADRCGVGSFVRFTGPVEDTARFLHAADVLVHPTFYDPCSRVVLEALASGIPPITTRYDGAADFIEEGVHGFVLNEPFDVRTMAEHLGRLVDPKVRRRIGAAAGALADVVSMRRHADEVIGHYQTEVSRASE